MSEKTLRQVVLALGALLALYVVVRLVSAVSGPKSVTGGALKVALEGIAGDSLVGAKIVNPHGGQILLRKTATGWTANGYRGDSVTALRLTRAVHQSRIADLAGRNPDNFARLGVADDSAWQVQLLGTRDTVDLLVGGMGRFAPSAYMRLPGDSTVYDVAGDLLGAIESPLSDWRDRAILRVDTAAVRTVVIERDRARYRLVRTDSTWRGGRTATGPANDSTDVQQRVGVLMGIANFDASGFITDSVPWQGKDSRRVVALGAKGDTLGVVEFVGDSSTWLARTPGNPQVWRVASYQVDRITPKMESLIPAGH